MSKLRTFLKLWRTNKREIVGAVFNHIVHTGILNCVPDELFLKMTYCIHVGKKLNLVNPKGFNEKLQWLKLHDRNPELTKMVDKYEVKNYVAGLIDEEFIIPTYGVWDDADNINFNNLPNKFVIKCTHDSGSVIVCKNKEMLNVDKVRKKLKKNSHRNLYYWGREWPYKNVEPRIIAEKYLEDSSAHNGLIDYKLMCFNGKVKCSFTVTNRFSDDEMHVTFYDTDWNIMPFERHYPADKVPVPKPVSYQKMVEIAEILSKDLTFARIDFYEVEEHPFFGEITLCPGNGVEEFNPDKWDYVLGDWMDLAKIKEIEKN